MDHNLSAFSNNLKVDQNRLLILDHNVRRQNKVDQNAFTMQLLHVIWKPANPFRDQKIRPYVEVKNKFWKTWLLFPENELDRISAKLIQSSILEFWGMTQAVLLVS